MGSLRRRLRGEGLPAHQQRRQERQRPVLGLRSQDVHAVRPQLQHLRLPQDQRRDGSGASSGELLRVARLVLVALAVVQEKTLVSSFRNVAWVLALAICGRVKARVVLYGGSLAAAVAWWGAVACSVFLCIHERVASSVLAPAASWAT